MKKFMSVSSTILLVLVLTGCAAQQPQRQVVDNVFTSDYPPLQITILNPDFKSDETVEKHGLKGWIYEYDHARGMSIVIEDIGGLHSGGKSYDYYERNRA